MNNVRRILYATTNHSKKRVSVYYELRAKYYESNFIRVPTVASEIANDNSICYWYLSYLLDVTNGLQHIVNNNTSTATKINAITQVRKVHYT